MWNRRRNGDTSWCDVPPLPAGQLLGPAVLFSGCWYRWRVDLMFQRICQWETPEGFLEWLDQHAHTTHEVLTRIAPAAIERAWANGADHATFETLCNAFTERWYSALVIYGKYPHRGDKPTAIVSIWHPGEWWEINHSSSLVTRLRYQLTDRNRASLTAKLQSAEIMLAAYRSSFTFTPEHPDLWQT